jgi:hypothetical protein
MAEGFKVQGSRLMAIPRRRPWARIPPQLLQQLRHPMNLIENDKAAQGRYGSQGLRVKQRHEAAKEMAAGCKEMADY